MYQNTYLKLKKKSRRQRAKENKEKKRISVENLKGYNDIVCKLGLSTLTYLIESWISAGYKYEFNVVYDVVYIQWQQLQYLLHYNNIWSKHFQENYKRKS